MNGTIDRQTSAPPDKGEQPAPGARDFAVDAHLASGGLSTLNADGSRRWLDPKPAFGRLWAARRVVAFVLIAVFVALPWTTINGRQTLLLDLTTRRFDIFGHRFLPTDTVLLALLGLGVFLTVFFVTAVWGRVWCGWACPQTVYMEFVFRPLERLLTTSPTRKARNWLQRSGAGRPLLWAIYIVLSFALANTFLAYFVGSQQLSTWLTRSPLEHLAPFVLVLVVTALMLFNFGFFREQTCIVVCPYGRFQSVLLDRQSTIVAYDRARGEPRGKATAAAREGIALPVLAGAATVPGDCVDCGACVRTCPTGIDIRNGLQMECVNCTQCIDACDAVMSKLKRPLGLIGYRSQAQVERAPDAGHRLRPRVIIYPALLTVVCAAFVVVLLMQAPSYVRVIRGLGQPYTVMGDGLVANPIKVHVISRRDEPTTYRIAAADGASTVRLEGVKTEGAGATAAGDEASFTLQPGESRTVAGLLLAPAGAFVQDRGHYAAKVSVTDSGGYSKTVYFHMTGPVGAPANQEKQP
jgi:cytochrome c oxidase accessory protein FixG